MKAEEYLKEKKIMMSYQDKNTHAVIPLQLGELIDMLTDFAEKDKERISCLVGYLKMWLNGQRIPDELQKVVEEAEEYLFFEVITNHKNQKEE